MGFLGGFEWLIIALIIIFLFGARKIPDMARGIGRGIFEFRKAVNDGKKDEDKENDEPDRQ
ncbi:twin-arginine translocase TatA/TatE family subunit [Balneolales bacterium ANBcel1]|nr:twin-arginine translocase TatA/TatE family subunit [Balneolales bacterium ANBcel1]